MKTSHNKGGVYSITAEEIYNVVSGKEELFKIHLGSVKGRG